jgi:hypothetical protein
MTAVRKRRRFDKATFGAWSQGFATDFGITSEAADWLAALVLCDAEDVASALLVLTAEADVRDASEGEPVNREAVKARLTELRLQVEEGGGAVELWRAVARDVKARCDPDG